MIPTSVITGFLGSGKTTLISRILRDPEFARTAVIVNEFGDIGLDHQLIVASDDSVLTLSTGCLCCAVQSEVAKTLTELLERRVAGRADFDRVLIETSGLSDPAPMLQAMMTNSRISAAYRVAAVVTLVDTVHGDSTLDERPEACNQIALADLLLFSKADLRAPTDLLLTKLTTLNQSAPRMITTLADPSVLFGVPGLMALSERLGRTTPQRGHGEIETFTIVRERPLPAVALSLLLEAVVEHCGAGLLRLKGLVAIEEMPGRPAVIHGVRHVISPPEFLDRWPSEDERTRIVVIAERVPRHFVSRLLDAITAEVRDTIATC